MMNCHFYHLLSQFTASEAGFVLMCRGGLRVASLRSLTGGLLSFELDFGSGWLMNNCLVLAAG